MILDIIAIILIYLGLGAAFLGITALVGRNVVDSDPITTSIAITVILIWPLAVMVVIWDRLIK